MRFAPLVFLVGCTATELDVVSERGSLCAFGDEASAQVRSRTEFVAGEPMVFALSFSSPPQTCVDDLRATCVVLPDLALSFDMHVDGQAMWNEPEVPRPCPRIVGGVRVTCPSHALLRGTYTVTFGDASMKIDVPSAAEQAPCIQRE